MNIQNDTPHYAIDTAMLAEMLRGGYDNLMLHRDEVNDLNVFPVPDGDTGMNMCATLLGGLNDSDPSAAIPEFLSSFSHGCLMAARGNSGVILSQFIRGFAGAASGAALFDTKALKVCMAGGVARAYSAVVNPVEGTMLTVFRQSSEQLSDVSDDISLEDAFSHLIWSMEVSLENTPSLLAVLKEAGVVDSGGAGVLLVFKGMEQILHGGSAEKVQYTKSITHEIRKAGNRKTEHCGEDFGYCTEFILQIDPDKRDAGDDSMAALKNAFERIGNSIVFVTDEDIVKVHVHTHEPETALALAHPYGEFITIKIENMNAQHSEIIAKKKSKIRMPLAIIAVASGEGIVKYYYDIGADVIIEGGQTSNPATSEFIDAFEKVDAEDIIVLPNNSNVIMTALQAASVYDKAKVHVVETKSVAEGISALSMRDSSNVGIEETLAVMNSRKDKVGTVCVTRAARSAELSGFKIQKGDYIGVCGDSVLSCDSDRYETAMDLIRSYPQIDDKEVLTVIFGSGVTADDASALVCSLQEEYPLFDVVMIDGKQDIYDYIIAIE